MIPVNNGRGFILFTILNLYLLSVILAGKYYFKYVIIFSFLGYIITTFGDSAFYAMPFLINEGIDSFFIALNNINQLEHNSLNFFQVLCKNASHPIISLELSLNKSGYDVGFRYFFDSFFAIISVLPESLLNIELPKNISYLNTWLIWERERAVIPPGLIGYFSYSLGIIGILIGSFLYGLVAGIIQRFFYSNNYPVIMFFIAFGYGATIFNGDPLIFVSANLLLIIVLFVFLLNSKIIRLRIKNV